MVLFVTASLVFVDAALCFADLVSSAVAEVVCVATAAVLVAAVGLCVAPLVRFALSVLTVHVCGFAVAYFVAVMCGRVACWKLHCSNFTPS